MTTPTHSHKAWTDKGGHVTLSSSQWLGGNLRRANRRTKELRAELRRLAYRRARY